uniref:Ig-like domain-containing protein n=1 Tax=Callorhinchus milii TaxID=7868 RepID=A0A4W3HMR8_CALMI
MLKGDALAHFESVMGKLSLSAQRCYINAGCCCSRMIFPTDSEIHPSKSLTLVCETGEFYPGDVTLTWNKDGSEVKTGILFMKENNSKGLYKVSSSMEEPKPVQSGVIYTCLVSHVSLQTPAVFTVSNPSTALEGKMPTFVNVFLLLNTLLLEIVKGEIYYFI